MCSVQGLGHIMALPPPPTACLEITTGEFVFASVSAGSNSSNSNGQCESDEMLRDICESATAADVCERTD